MLANLVAWKVMKQIQQVNKNPCSTCHVRIYVRAYNNTDSSFEVFTLLQLIVIRQTRKWLHHTAWLACYMYVHPLPHKHAHKRIPPQFPVHVLSVRYGLNNDYIMISPPSYALYLAGRGSSAVNILLWHWMFVWTSQMMIMIFMRCVLINIYMLFKTSNMMLTTPLNHRLSMSTQSVLLHASITLIIRHILSGVGTWLISTCMCT